MDKNRIAQYLQSMPQQSQQQFATYKPSPQMFDTGGTPSTDNQMEMLLQGGGMRDDGMSRDPVSGNEVPPGSMAKEVRDDIPAQLSEGEYVVPADVVQFFGLKFFEDIIQEAKRGLADMQNRGRIGGTPVSEEPTSGGEAPEGFPFDISELQVQNDAMPEQQPPQMNKGGLISGFAPGGFTGISGQTTTPQLDNTASEAYFARSNPGAILIRFVAEGCKQKTVLAQQDRIPVASGAFEGGFVDITSDAGLKLVQNCNEINLNENEQGAVITRIGQDKFNEWQQGKDIGSDPGPDEEQEPTLDTSRNNDDDHKGTANPKDFIKNWDIAKLAAYADDVQNYYGEGQEDGFVKGLIKGVVSPIIKLNHKHIVARTSKILMEGGYIDAETGQWTEVNTDRDETTGQYTDKVTQMLSGILKSNPGGMDEGEQYKIQGNVYEYKGGKHLIVNPTKNLDPTVGLDPSLEPKNVDKDGLTSGMDNYIDLTQTGDPWDINRVLASTGNYDAFGNEPYFSTAVNTTYDGIDAGEIGSSKQPSWYNSQDDDDDNYPTTKDFNPKTKDKDGLTPSIATSYAKNLMNEKDDGASLDVEAKQYNKAQANLSDAYGGGEAAEKFKIFNKGGLVKKKKRATKKKQPI